MMEAVEFIHAEGWDAAPTLFALVPAELVAGLVPEDAAPLTLVVQEEMPAHIQPGSDELGDYITRLAWPDEVAGVILAQEIMFRDTSESGRGDADPEARPARLFSGVLREDGVELTLLQIRPTPEELERSGPFAQDDVQLRGGPGVAPAVLGALRYSLENAPESDLESDDLY